MESLSGAALTVRPAPPLQALERLRTQMAASPYADQVTEEQMRWFLMDRKLNIQEAEDKLIKMLRWRREFG